jgi:hypothetical protein
MPHRPRRPATWRLIVSAISAVGLACTSRGQSPATTLASVRDSIQTVINHTVEATRRQDIDAFMAGFAPDFEITATDGDQGTLAQLRANTLRDWGIIPATRDIWMRIDSLGPTGGDSAVVYTSQYWDRLMLERNGVTRDTVVTTQKHVERWRRTPAGWRNTHVKELGGTVMVNGKPYQE